MGFLRAIKIHSTISFGGEVKSSVLCSEILRHVKEAYRYEKDTAWEKFSISCSMFLLLRY
jgi:hypothetical protein